MFPEISELFEMDIQDSIEKIEHTKLDRLTYKSSMGDYGSAKEYEDEYVEICALRNALGKYEDLGFTPEEIRTLLLSKIGYWYEH